MPRRRPGEVRYYVLLVDAREVGRHWLLGARQWPGWPLKTRRLAVARSFLTRRKAESWLRNGGRRQVPEGYHVFVEGLAWTPRRRRPASGVQTMLAFAEAAG